MDRSKWFLLFATYVSYCAIYFARKPVSAMKGTLQKELDVPLTVLGNMDGAMLAGYAVGQFSLGEIVKRFGVRKPLLLAWLVCSVLTALMGYHAPAGYDANPHVMTILWTLCGLFAAPANPLLMLVLTSEQGLPKNLPGRAFIINAWTTNQQMGGFLANLTAGICLLYVGWQPTFAICGVVVAVGVPLLALALPRDEPSSNHKKDDGDNEKKKSGTSIWSVPGIVLLATAYLASKMARYCLMFWAPYFLETYAGFNSAYAATLASSFDVVGIVGALCCGVVIDRVYKGRTFAALLPLAAGAAVVFLLWAGVIIMEQGDGDDGAASSGTQFVHVLGLMIVGLLMTGPDSVLGSYVGRTLCEFAGHGDDVALIASASGLINGAGSFGAVLQGALTAKIIDAYSWPGVFIALAAAEAYVVLAVAKASRLEKAHLAKKNHPLTKIS